MNKFKHLTVVGWRQFQTVKIPFHPRLTIITGANGTGKSTLLNLLSRHFGYQRLFLSTPTRVARGGLLWSMGLFRWLKRKKDLPKIAKEPPNSSHRVIGELEYTDGEKTDLFVSDNQSVSYDVNVTRLQSVPGLHIDSHRPPALYRHVSQMPATPVAVADLTSGFAGELQQFYASGSSNQGSLYHLKLALINMAVFGYGNIATPRNQELVEIYEGFQDKLKNVLPASIGFRKFSVQSPEIVLETDTGNFVIDSASGGVIKLIEITWQLYSFSLSNSSFVATMDEPENHLHPSMQRTFLANLVDAFPDTQFIVVTHSPFVVSSVRDSNVVVLRYEDVPFIAEEVLSGDEKSPTLRPGSRVMSVTLDKVNKAGTALEVLREALGVDTTIPDWAEDRLQEIIGSYRDRDVDEETLDQMYTQLEAEGLVTEYPIAIHHLVSRR